MYLNCKTHYSLRYGTFTTEELVKTGAEKGATSLALTNINTTCDIWDFVSFCREANVKPIAGAEIRNEDTLCYILIAANNKGFTWINQFLSRHLVDKIPFPEAATDEHFFADLRDGFVIYPLGKKSPDKLFFNERIGVLPSEITK